MATRSRYGSYTYRPAGSSRYWFRFQFPRDVQAEIAELFFGGNGGKPKRKVEIALRDANGQTTSDQRFASLLALPLLHRHRLMVHEARNRRGETITYTDEDGREVTRLLRRVKVTGFKRPYPIGESIDQDGLRVFAGEDHAVIVDGERLVREVPNDLRILPTFAFEPNVGETPSRPKLLRKDADSEIIEKYIQKAKLSERTGDAAGLRRTLSDLKEMTGGKLLSELKRSDAKALVEYLQEANGISAARTKKLISYLKAAINYEIEENDGGGETRLQRNVFAKIEIATEDEDGDSQRMPFTEAEVAMLRANLDIFTDEMKLMLVWHVASSVRPCGIYSMVPDRGIEWEDGQDPDTGVRHQTRYLRIMKDKGRYGRRCLPIPQPVLDLGVLPNRIDGPLFKTKLPQLLVQINRRIDKLGIERSLYSGRHRAKDRLMTRGVDSDMRKAIMGHSRRMDAHDLYGTGFPMWKIKQKIDLIGF